AVPPQPVSRSANGSRLRKTPRTSHVILFMIPGAAPAQCDNGVSSPHAPAVLMIDIRGLTKTAQTGTHRVEILTGVDLFIPRGQFAAIMGPSGSGKSTLLGLMAGLDTPTAGSV